MPIDIRIDDRSVRLATKEIADLASFVARQEGAGLGLIDIAIVGEPAIVELNRRHLGRRGSTDVLSFDLSGGGVPGISGQIVICAPLAARQGPLHGLSKADELRLYVIHGLLHLMGYDDAADIRTAAKMHARQDELLSAWRRRRGRRAARRA